MLAFLLIGCADPDPFADTLCSLYAPFDVQGWTRSYEPVAGGDFGEEGWRTVTTVGPEDFEGSSAFLVEDSFEADYPTTDVYRIDFRMAFVCDEQGTWLRGWTGHRHDEDGDQVFDQDSSLVLDQPLLWMPGQPSGSWSDTVSGVYTLDGQSYDVEWVHEAERLEEGSVDTAGGSFEGLRIERRMGTQDSMTETLEWWTEREGEVLREEQWSFREREVAG